MLPLVFKTVEQFDCNSSHYGDVKDIEFKPWCEHEKSFFNLMGSLGGSFGRDSGIQLHRRCIFKISETSAQIIALISMLIEK